MATEKNKYEPVPESERPWLKLSGFHRSYFPLAWGQKNAYALYTPSVDRFIIVDHFDLWSMVETAKILTPKVSPIVYVRNRPTTDEMNLTNCLEFTTKHKKWEPEFGGPQLGRHKQSASLRKIMPDNIVHAGWPEDYSKPDRRAALYRLQEYALFTLRCVYSINLAIEYRNTFPEHYYVDNFFKGEFPDTFKTLRDGTTAPHGMLHEVKNILYHSNSVEEALSRIHAAWQQYSQKDITGIRQNFYHTMGIIEPEATRTIGAGGEWNKNYHESTAWVM